MIVRNVERAVTSDEHVDRAAPDPVTGMPTRREVLDSRLPARGREDPHDLVARGGQLGPGAMQGDEEAPPVRGWKLRPRIEDEPERCGVRSKLDGGKREVATVARAAKLGIGRERAALRVAVGPAVVGALAHQGEKVRRSAAPAPIPLVHRGPQRAGLRVEREPDGFLSPLATRRSFDPSTA